MFIKNETYLSSFQQNKFDLIDMECESLSRYLSFTNEYRYQYGCGAGKPIEILDSFDLVGTTECLPQVIAAWAHKNGNVAMLSLTRTHANAQSSFSWPEFKKAVDEVVEKSECDKALYRYAVDRITATLEEILSTREQ